MSGGKGGSQTTQVEIPQWIQQPSIRNMARAEALQKVGYQPYMGPDVAGFTQPQQQAMQSNLDAASAFGLVDPNLEAMSGMPNTTFFNGVEGYSSFPAYQNAVAELERTNPRQSAAYDRLFVREGEGNFGPGFTQDFNSNTPDFNFNPLDYSVFNANPYGEINLNGPTGMPEGVAQETATANNTTNFLTAADLEAALQGYQTINSFTPYDDSQLRQDINSRFESFNPAAQDLSGYATTDQLNAAIDGIPSYQPQDLSSYARTSDLYDDSQLRTDINSRFSNIPGFDPTSLQAQITANQQGLANLPAAQAPDLSNYATTAALSDAIGGINTYDDSQLREDINSRFSNIPQFDASSLQAQISANQQGLANLPTVSSPDLSGYATTDDLTSAISGINFPEYMAPDLSQYATTNDLTSAIDGLPPAQIPDLSGYATTGDLTSAISGIPQFDATNLQNQITANQTAIGNVPQYNDQGLLAAIQANQNAISGINTYDDTQLRQDINNRFSNFNPNVDLSNYATNASVDTLVNNLPTGQLQDLSNYVTNEQFNQGLQNLPTPSAPDLSNYATQSDLANINTYDDTQLRQDINNRFTNFTPNVDLSNYVTNSQLQQGLGAFTPYSDEALRADINARFGNIATFDPSGLQAQIQALQNIYNDVTPVAPQTLPPQLSPTVAPTSPMSSSYPVSQGLSFAPKGI